MGKVISIEGARVRKHERMQTTHWKYRDDLVWQCGCGSWQYEIIPTGIRCVMCGKHPPVKCT